MKNFVRYFVFVLTLISMAFLYQNCSKESSFSNDDKVVSNANSIYKTEPTHLQRHLVIDFPNLGDIDCYKPPINCWDDVVIRPNSLNYSVYTQLVSSYTNDTVPGFFTYGSYSLIFPYMTTENADDIIDGNLLLVIKENTTSDSTYMCIFLNGDANVNNFDIDDVVFTMPIKITN